MAQGEKITLTRPQIYRQHFFHDVKKEGRLLFKMRPYFRVMERESDSEPRLQQCGRNNFRTSLIFANVVKIPKSFPSFSDHGSLERRSQLDLVKG